MECTFLRAVFFWWCSSFVFASEDVGTCLASAGGGSTCAPSRDCSGVSFGDDRSCLLAAVPWLTPHSQVKCCFRCCLWYWQHELGLTEIRADWDKNLEDFNIPNSIGTKKHGWPDWDEVLFSHMTPFVWAATRRVSGAFLGGTRLHKSKNSFEASATAGSRSLANGFAMFEGGYPVLRADLDPSGSAPPAVVVVGTDEWLAPQTLATAARGPVKEWFVSNPFEREPIPGACFGAPTRAPKGSQDGSLAPVLAKWLADLKERGDSKFEGGKSDGARCWSPSEYYASTTAEQADQSSPVHAFPRALQKTTGWGELLNGQEAQGPEQRDLYFFCGGSIKLRGGRATVLGQLKRNGFPCVGAGHTDLAQYVSTLQRSRFAWSPPGHGWSNHREWEILLNGAVPVVEFHPSFLELYRGLPVLQVRDWSEVTPAVLEKEWARIQAEKHSYDTNKLYWPYWLHRFTKYMERVGYSPSPPQGAVLVPGSIPDTAGSANTQAPPPAQPLPPPPSQASSAHMLFVPPNGGGGGGGAQTRTSPADLFDMPNFVSLDAIDTIADEILNRKLRRLRGWVNKTNEGS